MLRAEAHERKCQINPLIFGNVLFPGKDHFNQAGGCVCHGMPASVGSLVILSLENIALMIVA